MASILPLIFIALSFAGFKRYLASKDGTLPCGRIAYVSSLVFLSLFVYLSTLGLSFLNCLVHRYILMLWLSADIVLAAAVITIYRFGSKGLFRGKTGTDVDLEDRMIISSIAVVSLFLLALALFSAPNTGDAQSYHLARVFHWEQNHNIFNYPANVIRQISIGPLAEYIILHLDLLSGSDVFANVVQWSAMTGCLAGVSLMALCLGADKKTQIFSSVLCLTIPMGVMQSTSTQTDYVAAFFLVAFMTIMFFAISRKVYFLTVLAGASLGMAWLTKAVTYLYFLPMMLWIIVLSRNKHSAVKTILFSGLAVSIAFLVNLEQYLRNYHLFGSIFGDPSITDLVAANISSVGIYLSNVLKNISLHLAPPVWAIQYLMYAAVKGVHAFFAIDPGHPGTTFGKYHIPVFMNFSFHEDQAGNFLHALLFFFALAVLVKNKDKIKKSGIMLYGACLIACFSLFSFSLKWQPWGSKLQLPLFVMAAPFIAVAVSGLNNTAYRKRVVKGAALTLLAGSVFSVMVFYSFHEGILNFVVEKIKLGIYAGDDILSHVHISVLLDRMFVQTLLFAVYVILCLVVFFRIKGKVYKPLTVILLISILPWLFFNQSKPVFGEDNIFITPRIEQYYVNRPELFDTHLGITEFISNRSYSNIGLSMGNDGFEYPLVLMLKHRGASKYLIRHVNVRNRSQVLYNEYPFNEFIPDAVVCFSDRPENTMDIKGIKYEKAFTLDGYCVFERKDHER